mmetsp:Transcript_4684/g.19071  ORF Transcript_4684/g.19071 Transcript_4684/m.19071 type:complete len:147 (+) Transcript_4684:265-705(+)
MDRKQDHGSILEEEEQRTRSIHLDDDDDDDGRGRLGVTRRLAGRVSAYFRHASAHMHIRASPPSQAPLCSQSPTAALLFFEGAPKTTGEQQRTHRAAAHRKTTPPDTDPPWSIRSSGPFRVGGLRVAPPRFEADISHTIGGGAGTS